LKLAQYFDVVMMREEDLFYSLQKNQQTLWSNKFLLRTWAKEL